MARDGRRGRAEPREEQRRNQGNMHRAQVTLVGDHGILLRAEEYAPDFYSAIDTVHDNLQRQIQRYKDKHWRGGKLRGQAGEIVEVGMDLNNGAVSGEEGRPRIVRTKEFQVKPMFSDEAVEQITGIAKQRLATANRQLVNPVELECMSQGAAITGLKRVDARRAERDP